MFLLKEQVKKHWQTFRDKPFSEDKPSNRRSAESSSECCSTFHQEDFIFSSFTLRLLTRRTKGLLLNKIKKRFLACLTEVQQKKEQSKNSDEYYECAGGLASTQLMRNESLITHTQLHKTPSHSSFPLCSRKKIYWAISKYYPARL